MKKRRGKENRDARGFMLGNQGKESRRRLRLFLGLFFILLLLSINGVNRAAVPDVHAIPLSYFLDWDALPNGANGGTTYPYTEPHPNVNGSGVDVTLTIPTVGQDSNYRDIVGPTAYAGDSDVFRYYHVNGNGDPVTVVIDFSQPVVIDNIVFGGNRAVGGVTGVLEFAAYDGPNGTGNIVLPNPAVYPDPAFTAAVIPPNTIPGTAPLNIINGGPATYVAEYVPARQSYVSLGFDSTRRWALIDYEGVVVNSLTWTAYCTSVTDPQTARDNLVNCQFNSAYLGGFNFEPAVDWGDLPDTSVGTGTANYNTLNSDSGPSHVIDLTTYLGSCVESELDGQPHVYAGTDAALNGDDGSVGGVVGRCDPSGDDEDGIVFVTPLPLGGVACVDVTTSAAGVLNGWIDFNDDGDFGGAGEQIFNDEAMSAGLNSAASINISEPTCFNVAGSVPPAFYARFRYTAATTQGGGSPTGPASNGEVEDYYITQSDLGDLPDTGAGTGVGNYQTLLINGGPSHIIDGSTYLGSCVDTDFDGQPDTEAGVDVVGGDNGNPSSILIGSCGPLGDEDGVVFPSALPLGTLVCVDVTASAAGALNGWIDYDGNGDFLGAGEQIFTDQALVSGLNSPCFTVPAASSAITVDQAIYARFRFTAATGQGGSLPTGAASNGEVEDYYHVLQSEDWGDLPATFATTNAGGGAKHLIDASLYLGACVDSETDGQVDAQAGMGVTGGDDNNVGTPTGTCSGNDDEDGVTLLTPLIPGGIACASVTAVNNTGGAATLFGWIDFNGDGDFVGDAADQLTFTSATVANGGVSNQPYCFAVPADATFDGGETHMRFRLSTDASLNYGGLSSIGEVEDYYQPLACVGNYVWSDSGATPNIQDASDAPLNGIDVRLVWAGADDTVNTTVNDSAAQGDDSLYTVQTDGNGRYNFCGLTPDAANTYRVDIFTPPAGANQVVTVDQGGNDVLDSDGAQAAAGAPVAGPAFTIGDPINLATGENGNQDNPGGINNFPDAQDDLRYDFGFQQTIVAIGNIVWDDSDANGMLNGAETGIDGVTVELFLDNGDAACDPATDASQGTQTTAGGGFYNFLNVAPGNYCVGVFIDGTIIGPAGAYTLSSPGGGHNPDTTGDHPAVNGDDGIPGATYVASQVFSANVGGQTVLTDSGDPAGYPDNSAYMTVDFGFIPSGPTAVNLLGAVGEASRFIPVLAMLVIGLGMGSFAILRRRQTN